MNLLNLFENESPSGYYYEQVAAQLPAGLESEDDILDAAWDIVVKDLGRKVAHNKFNYDEDFLGDLLSAYKHNNQQDVEEGDVAKLAGITALGIGAGLGANYLDQQTPKVEFDGKNGQVVKAYLEPAYSNRIPDNAMVIKGKDGKTYHVWSSAGKGMNSKSYHAAPVEQVKESDDEVGTKGWRVIWSEAGSDKHTSGLLLKPHAIEHAKMLQKKPGTSNVKVVPYRSVNEGPKDAAPKMGSQERKMAAGAVKGAKDLAKSLPGMYRDKNGILRLNKEVKEGEVYDLDKEYGAPALKPKRRDIDPDNYNPYPYTQQQDDDYFRELFRKQRAAKAKAERDSDHERLATGTNEGEQQKGADYRDPKEADYGDDYQDMVKRLKHLAGAGPLKTVYDPTKRVYKNMPTATQPKTQPKK